ncbi:class I adenylate-forming enzyme family protein [Streptomyces sp. SRF1]|uniref:class I adenylate-forming enzyme family protein n=1 Tax=Streptomyces sp. SRF1 TaxID=1549642 RepID=UPI0025B05ECC|nr:class I adenylate-forming enzyme family protein [Streptomyces sp. SRF1]MDN3059775.1 class I adenylate-forming enzyme family protein [Streptomyces sp. SRF1]
MVTSTLMILTSVSCVAALEGTEMQQNLNDYLDQTCSKHGARPAWRFGSREATYAELLTATDRVAGALESTGLAMGDRAAFLLKNSPEILELHGGMSRAGVIAVPLNFRSVARELAHVVNDSGSRVVVFGEEFVTVVDEMRAVAPSDVTYVMVGPSATPSWSTSYAAWLERADGQARSMPEIAPEHPYFIGYTSGTTGAPKGAVVSHRALIRHVLSIMLEYGAPSEPRDRFLSLMPMFHSNGTWFGTAAMMAGAVNVIHPSGGFDPHEVLRVVEAERITHTSVVPTMLKMMVGVDSAHLAALDTSSLRMVLVASAPVTLSLKRETERVLGTKVNEGYGSTETGCVTSLRPGDPDEKHASVGRPTIGREISIRDHDGQECPIGTAGEIWTRGEGVLLDHYWNNPEATRRAFDDAGWCTVGDMGYLDADGYLFMTDRKHDMIISGGENVYPTEVESVLLGHPSVSEVAVVGLPHEHWGETVQAVVVLKAGAVVTSEELIEFSKAGLADFKVPRSVRFVDELPKSATGKILRRLVRRPVGTSDDARSS